MWRAGPRDADAVAELMVAFRDWWGRDDPPDDRFRAGVARLLDDPDTEFLLAGDGEPVGVCQLRYRYGIWRDGEDCCLEDLYVRDAERGTGAGRALAEAAIARARDRGCVRMVLDVVEDNAPPRTLYESLGFESGGREGSRSLFMKLALDD